MTRWIRARFFCLCGLCGRGVQVGEPLFEVKPAGLKVPMLRCAACAWSPVPPDLPALVVEHATTSRMEPVATVATRAVRDVRQRQTGEDDE